MSTKGQTISDRLNAAKYTLSGQALARCIYKATTEELIKPKKKHLDYLAASTYQPNVSIQQLATLLIARTNHSNWAVVYKALITVHHLTCFGSEKFIQYLASSNYTFQLSHFLDRIITKGYEMSQFIRRYSNYINEKALSYRKLAIDLCRAQRRKDDEPSLMRTMPIERLLETFPVIQKQMDTLLDFGCTPDDLSNSIITASFTLLNHDVTRLFASYNDGIINLFEKYFDLNKKMCREAFEAYKKFLACTDRVVEFLKVAASINLTNDKMPDFKQAPSSLLDALEQHLISLESNKKRDMKEEVDTKLAAFPSFSFGNDCEAPSQDILSQQEPQSQELVFSDISKDFEAQLNFTTNSSDFDVLVSTSNNNSKDVASTFNNNDEFTKADPFSTQALYDQSISLATVPQPSLQAKSYEKNKIGSDLMATSAAFEPFPSNVGDDIFDMKPPGFSDGNLLTPEALQINIDPSIDPHTKQQLIQIKREQVLASRQGGNNSAQQAATLKQSKSNAKPSKDSMFEDLERTMRKSLLKQENV